MATIRRYTKRHFTGCQANAKPAPSPEPAPEKVLSWQR